MEKTIIEEELIKKYVIKEKQNRLLWELKNPKKRNTVILRFAGTNCFKTNCLHAITYMSGDVMKRHLLHLSNAKDVYFVGESYVGTLSLEQAVAKAQTGEICIIYCGKGIGYYQGEQENGKPPRFLLLSGGQGDGLREPF